MEADPADGAGVGAAAGGFEFFDDFHGADFGSAGDGAAGEGGGDDVEEIFPGGGAAFDVGDDVHDVGVVFDGHEFGDADGAEGGDAAEVVADEVDEHEVFGAFFGVGGEFAVELVVFGIGGAAGAGAGDGAGLDFAVAEADEEFGGAGDEGEAGEAEERHVGGGVDAAEFFVDFLGGGAKGAGFADGEVDLVGVAGADVVLDLADAAFEFGLGKSEGGILDFGLWILDCPVVLCAWLYPSLREAPDLHPKSEIPDPKFFFPRSTRTDALFTTERDVRTTRIPPLCSTIR